MKILIFGAAGYIGSVLTPRLLREGYEIIAVDNLSRGYNGIAPNCSYENFTFVYGDVRETTFLVNVFNAYNPQICINLAAIVGAPECDADPENSKLINTVAAQQIAIECDSLNIPLIMPSTISIFNSEGEVCDETEPDPQSLYAKTKWYAEQRVKQFCRACVPRFTTVMGVSPNMRWGIMPNRLVRDAVSGKIELYQPEVLRTFINVEDIVEVIVYITKYIDKFENVSLNIGAPLHLTKRDFVSIIEEYEDFELAIVEGADQDKRDFTCYFDKMNELVPGMEFRPIEQSIESLVKLAQLENYNV